MSTTLRYNYRLRPSKTVRLVLSAEWDRSRWMWNQCVAAAKDRDRRWISDKDLTAARARLPWLRSGSQNVQQQLLRTFVKSKGRKKFKSGKKTLPSLQYTTRGFGVKDNTVQLGA